jgi:hypothetical protein
MSINKKDEEKNKDYLEHLLQSDESKLEQPKMPFNNGGDVPNNGGVQDIEYSNINLNILPAGRYYQIGTKISIRAAKVSEIQAYSMVDDNNFVDITEKMNELLSRNVIYIHPNGEKGSYRDIKDADRIFLIFMIRELTFQGGNTLTREVSCKECNHEFAIPFRSTPNNESPATFELHEHNEEIDEFFDKQNRTYELVYKDVSWKLAPPTIGVQEDFYTEIKRNVQADKKPNVAFMKVMPFLLYDRSSVTEEEIKEKFKEFTNMDDSILFQGLNDTIDKMTVGIKGLKMKCSECGEEVHTDLTFPSGASTLFKHSNIMDNFRRKN